MTLPKRPIDPRDLGHHRSIHQAQAPRRNTALFNPQRVALTDGDGPQQPETGDKWPIFIFRCDIRRLVALDGAAPPSSAAGNLLINPMTCGWMAGAGHFHSPPHGVIYASIFPGLVVAHLDSRRAEGEKNSFVRRLIARHDARPDAARTAAAARSKRKINVQRPPDGIL